MTPPSWHALLAPLPPDAVPTRRPVVTAELAATPEGATVAGWSSVVLELSAGADGLRVLQVVVDDSGVPIGASDHVLFGGTAAGQPDEAAPILRHESIGGRFEPDGAFRGTCWLVTGPEPAEGEKPRWDMAPRAPEPAEVEALRALVKDLLRREAHG